MISHTQKKGEEGAAARRIDPSSAQPQDVTGAY